MNRAIAVLILLGLPMLAFPDVKIGYIDSAKILQEYKGMESIKKQFDREQAEWQKTAEEMLRELENLKRELENQRVMLTKEALERKEEEVRSKQREYEEFLQQIWGPGGRAAQKDAELTKPVVDKINSVLEQLAKDEGFTMIFDIAAGSVVYAKDGLDLTDMVLEELNREYAPATEVEETKIAIFRFEELTPLAEEGNYADQVYELVHSLMDRSPKFETIPRERVETLLFEMGLEREKSIALERALDIAKSVDAKIMLVGDIRKEVARIEVRAELVDVGTGQMIVTETQTAEGETEEAFQSMISNLVATLTQRYGG
ncbi:hypothetical protein AMJ40_01420 [candidate division TA06 bacterium DG_26]|uniref:OmpH family outer membrane protein n=1 Tax=candidate division TA06 bacterium DG_26 TaxID=1703771 RepID=A0A0S7WL81_UNCT6|nr:MAG: hypothetical protein AMJ40_01420 [candidate division TA06 bacterium DG_26]